VQENHSCGEDEREAKHPVSHRRALTPPPEGQSAPKSTVASLMPRARWTREWRCKSMIHMEIAFPTAATPIPAGVLVSVDPGRKPEARKGGFG